VLNTTSLIPIRTYYMPNATECVHESAAKLRGSAVAVHSFRATKGRSSGAREHEYAARRRSGIATLIATLPVRGSRRAFMTFIF